MGNEVAKASPFGQIQTVDTKSLAQKAAADAQNSPRQGAPGGADYMNYSGKRGICTIGQDKRTVQPDEMWVVNVASFESGWICWKGGKPISTRLSNIFTGVPVAQPAEDELGPFNHDRGEGWFQAKAVIMKSIDNDQQGYFKINSVSGVAELSNLQEEFAKRAQMGEAAWPVICIEHEEFEAQGYKNFKPKFVVQGWLSDDAMAELANEDSDKTIEDLIEMSMTGGPAVADQSNSASKEKEAPADTPKSTRRRRRS